MCGFKLYQSDHDPSNTPHKRRHKLRKKNQLCLPHHPTGKLIILSRMSSPTIKWHNYATSVLQRSKFKNQLHLPLRRGPAPPATGPRRAARRAAWNSSLLQAPKYSVSELNKSRSAPKLSTYLHPFFASAQETTATKRNQRQLVDQKIRRVTSAKSMVRQHQTYDETRFRSIKGFTVVSHAS